MFCLPVDSRLLCFNSSSWEPETKNNIPILVWSRCLSTPKRLSSFVSGNLVTAIWEGGEKEEKKGTKFWASNKICEEEWWWQPASQPDTPKSSSSLRKHLQLLREGKEEEEEEKALNDTFKSRRRTIVPQSNDRPSVCWETRSSVFISHLGFSRVSLLYCTY